MQNKKIIFDRIQFAENCFGDLCSEFSSLIKRKSKVRDKYDELSGIMKLYANAEGLHGTLSVGMTSYAKALTLLADVSDLEIQRMHTKIVRDLASYENICRNAKESMKHMMLMRGKEMARRHHFEQMQRKRKENVRLDRKNSVEKESTAVEATRIETDFDENAMKFERQKNDDLKRLLLEMVKIEMKQHAKSLEILSATYQDLANVDEERDLDEFREKFAPTTEGKNLKPEMRSQSMNVLSTTSGTNSLAETRKSATSSQSLDVIDSKKTSAAKENQLLDIQTDEMTQTETEEESDEDDEDESAATESNTHDDKDKSEGHNESDDDDVFIRQRQSDKGQNENKFVPKPIPRARLTKRT